MSKKMTRANLKRLIMEERAALSSVLLESPPQMGSSPVNQPVMNAMGTDVHSPGSPTNDSEGEGTMARRSLYHMSQQSQQLHDMLADNENLEEWVQAKITKAADYLEAAFKAITYDKGPGQQGR